MIWKMKNGRKIEVSDMTENHAMNIINMIIRQNSPKDLLDLILIESAGVKRNLVKKKTEVIVRGDMAQQWNDINEEHDFLDEMDPWDY
jgi:hypothetical protein